MAYIRGKRGSKVTMFPVTWDEFIPAEHACRVSAAFVNQLEMAELGFPRSGSAKPGRARTRVTC